VETYCRRFPGLKVVFTRHPLKPQEAGLYVIEIGRIDEIPRNGTEAAAGDPTGAPIVPVLGYGPAVDLSAAWNAGCADYLKSPWTVTELHFRIDRLLFAPGRRTGFGPIEVSDSEIICGQNRHDLSAQERKILSFLLRTPGAAVPREALYYGIWGTRGTGSRVVDMHISKLRSKLKDLQRDLPGGDRLSIITMRGEGYCIR
jgi:DNA-binding response OmpR family regulator